MNGMDEKTKIEIRSEEVQEILSHPPRGLIRWGSTAVCLILAVFFTGSFFFSYPDTIDCKITLTTSDPPIWIVAKSTGRIKELYIRDKQRIEIGGVIAAIENPADTRVVLSLERQLAQIRMDGYPIKDISVRDINLGDIQDSYTSFVKAASQYNNSLQHNLYGQKIKSEEAQLPVYGEYIASMTRQMRISDTQHRLAKNEYGREKKIYEGGLTSVSEVETAEQTLLGRRMSAEQTRSALAGARVQMAQVRNNINELRIQRAQEIKENETALYAALQSLRNDIKVWKQTYLLTSPMDGILSYANIWKANQNISSGDRAFSVTGRQKGLVLGKIQIPVAGSGKVRTGQRVNVKLDGYPYLEYGFLTGEIISVASMSDSDVYMATVKIPSPLTTSYHKDITMRGDLSGTAEIITSNLSVAERMLSPFRYIINRNM
jgi:HlyD family secretion protein